MEIENHKSEEYLQSIQTIPICANVEKGEPTSDSVDQKKKKRGKESESERPNKRRALNPNVNPNAVFLSFENLPMDFILEVKNSLDSQFKDIPEAKNSKCTVITGERVCVKPNAEEARQKRQQYRKEYRRRPLVIQKRLNKSKEPEVIQKRKEYSSRPDVKLRKKLLSKRRRRALKALKEGNPEIYKQVMFEEPLCTSNYDGNPLWVPKECWSIPEEKNQEETDDSSEESDSDTDEIQETQK
jgi:hypothetical protein